MFFLKHRLQRINRAVAGVSIEGAYSCDPVIDIVGEYLLDSDAEARAETLRRQWCSEGHLNEPVAIVTENPRWEEPTLTLRVRTIDFAGLRALQDRGEKPPQLGAAVLAVDARNRFVIIHHRAPGIEIAPDRFHLVCGGYTPPDDDASHDKVHLRWTAVREAFEELGLIVGIREPEASDAPSVIALREFDTGSVMVCYLGAPVLDALSDADADRAEGTMRAVRFDDIAQLVRQPTRPWVASGRASLLAWLALDAPGAGTDPTFAGDTPAELFDRLVPPALIPPAHPPEQQRGQRGE